MTRRRDVLSWVTLGLLGLGTLVFLAAYTGAAYAGARHGRSHTRSLVRSKTFVVNSSDDQPADGCDASHCNLREAVLAANVHVGKAIIEFRLPADSTRIALLSELPALGRNIVLRGESQGGAECPNPAVQLDGSLIQTPGANGLVISGNRVFVSGLAIGGFGGHGVVVSGNSNSLECLFVGTEMDGVTPAGNGGNGILVVDGRSNRVGGSEATRGNLISANTGWGIRLYNAINTSRSHNRLGVDIHGNPTLPNGDVPAPITWTSTQTPSSDVGDSGDVLSPESFEEDHERIRELFEQELAEFEEREGQPILGRGPFKYYAAMIGARGVPGLFELSKLLEADPDLYERFTGDADRAAEQRRRKSATELTLLRADFGRFLPELTRETEAGVDQRNVLLEILALFDPDTFVTSGPPSQELAAAGFNGPIQIDPIKFSLLTTYGPQVAALNAELEYFEVCEAGLPCAWPVGWDFLPWSMSLLWESSSLSQAVMEKIVLEDGYFLTLSLNGSPLYPGPAASSDPLVSFTASTLPGSPCPTGKQCIATVVYARKKLEPIPLPWAFELKVEKLEDLTLPIILGFDDNGNPQIAYKEKVLFSKVLQVIAPNGTSATTWFEAALLPTFQSDRCTDCHGFGTFDAIAEHHGHSDEQGFVNSVNLHLEPSAYVAGAHVMACVNCHYIPTQHNGDPFQEIIWKAPFHDLDSNWGQKNAQQICDRVTASLPTSELIHEHFHEDARLHWAIENPSVMGTALQPAAEPMNWDLFLKRVDLWNLDGTKCP